MNYIERIKIVFVVIAVLIVTASLLVSHFLVKDLSNEERTRMEIWAEALYTFNQAEENTDLSLVLSVLQGNNTIPVIVLNPDGLVSDWRNIDIKGHSASDTAAYLAMLGKKMYYKGFYIPIDLGEYGHQYVCYDESIMLRRLSVWPYIQLTIVLIFGITVFIFLLVSKRAEQNKVWVGLSKETAHQLGTPISSLMAWIEMLKESSSDHTIVYEMEQDIGRLVCVAERFSKVGSVPELVETNVIEILDRVINYMEKRVSCSVKIKKDYPDHVINVMMCAPLFEWVIENLCKNAVDAMRGEGEMTLRLEESESGRNISVEVIDNGCGIRKKDFVNVFNPGFTTKKRGWGLGLSLARRIIDEYHKGRIYIKSSEIGKGTIFRIDLKR